MQTFTVTSAKPIIRYDDKCPLPFGETPGEEVPVVGETYTTDDHGCVVGKNARVINGVWYQMPLVYVPLKCEQRWAICVK
jgi:hypothetical protein